MAVELGVGDLGPLSSLGDPVRGRLYAFVSGREEPVSRDEAAAAVGIDRALAAYHLDKLLRAGLLTASYRRAPGRGGPGAGRPAKVYGRSGREFAVSVPPRDYELAARLLARAMASDRGGVSQAGLLDAARRLGTELGRSQPAGSAGRRALEAVLTQHGFEPWADAEGTIRLRNCPFRHLADLHPDVICGMNLALIEGIAAGLGAAGLHPVPEPWPGHCCVAIRLGTS